MKNILEYLERSARRFPDRISFADPEKEVTYAGLLARARRIGTAIAQIAEPGSPVPVFMGKGVDTIAGDTALRNGSAVISYLADSMVRRIRSREAITAIQRGQLLLLSAVKPDLGFTAASAMMRNRYIYAQSVGTVAVRADYKKGGTWNGATDCIRHGITPVFCAASTFGMYPVFWGTSTFGM